MAIIPHSLSTFTFLSDILCDYCAQSWACPKRNQSNNNNANMMNHPYISEIPRGPGQPLLPNVLLMLITACKAVAWPLFTHLPDTLLTSLSLYLGLLLLERGLSVCSHLMSIAYVSWIKNKGHNLFLTFIVSLLSIDKCWRGSESQCGTGFLLFEGLNGPSKGFSLYTELFSKKNKIMTPLLSEMLLT